MIADEIFIKGVCRTPVMRMAMKCFFEAFGPNKIARAAPGRPTECLPIGIGLDCLFDHLPVSIFQDYFGA
jgi:hypothetical protein